MSHKEKLQRLRQVGLFTKGAVYCLLGGLVAMAAIGAGGDISGKKGVIRFLIGLPLGEALVAIIATGLLAYSLWRFYMAYEDPKNNDSEKRWGTKVRYVYSGLFYGFIAFTFAKALFEGSSSDDGSSKKAVLAQLLDKGWGPWVIGGIALLVAGQAVFQFYRGYSGKFMDKLDDHPNEKHSYRIIKNTGHMGYYSRGVVFGILSYFLFKVVMDHSADAYNGTKGVFQYLLSFDYGSLLMGIVALGLLGYGVFTIMVGRYSNLTKLS